MTDIENKTLNAAIEKVIADFMTYQLEHNKLRYFKFRSLMDELKKDSLIDDYQAWLAPKCIRCCARKSGEELQFYVPLIPDTLQQEVMKNEICSMSFEIGRETIIKKEE